MPTVSPGYGKTPAGALAHFTPDSTYSRDAMIYGGAEWSGGGTSHLMVALIPLRWGKSRGAVPMLDPGGRFVPGIPVQPEAPGGQ